MSGLIWFQKRESNRRNRFFALLIILVSIQIAKDMAGFRIHPAIYLGLQGTCLFIGPTVYLYIRSMLGISASSSRQLVKYYLIGFIYLIVILSLVLTLPSSPQIQKYISPPLAIAVGYTLMFAQLYHVLWFFQRSLTRLRLHTKLTGSTPESFEQRRKWLFTIVVALIVIISLFVLPFLFITAFGDTEVLYYLKYGFLLSLSIGLNIVTIKSFNNPEIVLSFPQVKYGDTALSVGGLKSIQSKLSGLMIKEQPYLNSELKLDGLAEMIAVRPVHLSQVINDQHGKNFSEYINEYRVNEAKRILSEEYDEHSSMYEVAIDAGFNSKATFNRVFKQMTGSTPTQFAKNGN